MSDIQDFLNSKPSNPPEGIIYRLVGGFNSILDRLKKHSLDGNFIGACTRGKVYDWGMIYRNSPEQSRQYQRHRSPRNIIDYIKKTSLRSNRGRITYVGTFPLEHIPTEDREYYTQVSKVDGQPL